MANGDNQDASDTDRPPLVSKFLIFLFICVVGLAVPKRCIHPIVSCMNIGVLLLECALQS